MVIVLNTDRRKDNDDDGEYKKGKFIVDLYILSKRKGLGVYHGIQTFIFVCMKS